MFNKLCEGKFVIHDQNEEYRPTSLIHDWYCTGKTRLKEYKNETLRAVKRDASLQEGHKRLLLKPRVLFFALERCSE